MEPEEKAGGAPAQENKDEREEQVETPEQPQEESEPKKPLSQEDFDKLYGEMKAAKEESKRERERRLKLEGENFKLQERTQPPQPVTTPTGQKLPTSKEEWEEWNAEDPFEAQKWLATQTYAEQKRTTERVKTQDSSRQVVYDRHKDMYNDDGTLDLSSEKGKLYNKIAEEDKNVLYLVNGPELVMAEMERRLNDKRSVSEKAKAEAEARRTAEVDRGFVPSGGNTPPPPKRTVALSGDQQTIARKMGLSDEEYSRYKENKPITAPQGATR